nr:unnamed protein product [Callosobruchus chinensis]
MPDRFNCAPSEETDLTEINLESLKACKGQSIKNKSSTHIISQKTPPPPATPSISRPVAAIQDLTPSAKDLAEAGPSGCLSLVNDGYVSPQDIMPIPKPKKKLSNKGPKPMICSIVTSSPYKRALEEAQNKKNEKFRRNKDNEKENNNYDQCSIKIKNKCLITVRTFY